jgi:hypothetical protein
MFAKTEVNILSNLIAQLTKSIANETNVSVLESKTLSLKSAQVKLDRLLCMADL